MKPHKILKSFPGSQTGHDHHQFEEGTTAHLSDSLAAVVVPLGWAEPHEQQIQPRTLAPNEMLEADELPEGAAVAEEKDEGPAPENKMKKAPENKKAKK